MEFDFLIVGAGISGQTLAHKIAQRNFSVLLVEKGNKDLKFNSTAYSPDSSLTSNKINFIEGIGGSINLWAGRLMSLNLEEINESSGSDQVMSYVSEEYLNLAINHLKFLINDRSNDLSISDFVCCNDGVSGLTLVPAIWLKNTPRCGSSSRLYRLLTKDSNVTIYTGHEFVRFIWRNNDVVGGEFKVGGETVSLFAKKIVMACGCNSNIKNLLLDKKYNSDGPLAELPAIGKYLIEHPVFVTEAFKEREIELKSYAKPIYEKNKYKQFGITNNSELNSYVVIKRVLDEYERNVIESLFNLVREVKRFQLSAVIRTMCLIFKSRNKSKTKVPESLFYSLPHTSIPRWLFHLLRLFDLKSDRDSVMYKMSYHFTVKPNVNNRALLDRDDMLICHIKLGEELYVAKKDISELSDALFGGVTNIPENTKFLDSSHLMGGTRIGINYEDSVVDPNLRVHKTRNLYIVGSSTFPCFGVANPTLHILAQALWLSDRI